jgi:hypothetical protein
MHIFDERALLAALEKLPPLAQTAFAYAAASRAQDLSLEKLSEEGSALCANSLKRVFAHLSGSETTKVNLSLLSKALEGSAELDIDQMAACAYLLRCVLLGGAENAAWTARRSYEAADQRAQEQLSFSAFSLAIEQAIVTSAVVQSELASQASDLSLLQANPLGHQNLAEQYQRHV